MKCCKIIFKSGFGIGPAAADRIHSDEPVTGFSGDLQSEKKYKFLNF